MLVPPTTVASEPRMRHRFGSGCRLRPVTTATSRR